MNYTIDIFLPVIDETFSIEKTYPIETDNYVNDPLKISLFRFRDIFYKDNKTKEFILKVRKIRKKLCFWGIVMLLIFIWPLTQ